MSNWTPSGPFARLVELAGFLYDPAQDIIYSRMDALQRPLGYAYAYDASALLMDAVIDCEPIFFTARGKMWMIELWKGQYGLETGCEIGVYNRPLDPPAYYPVLDAIVGRRPYDPAHGFFYQSAASADMLDMSFTLKRDGAPFLTRGREAHWWLTGFRWGVYSTPEQLVMAVSISLPDPEMHDALVAALHSMGYAVTDDGATVGFEFDRPFAPQPWTNNPGLGPAQAAQQAIVATYRSFGLPNNDPNQIPEALAARIAAAVVAKSPDFFGKILASQLHAAGELAYRAAGLLANDLSMAVEAVVGWMSGVGYDLNFSCYAAINNRLAGDLTLAGQDVGNGHFVTLPQTIHAGSAATVWLQRDPGVRGSLATVVYRAVDGTRTTFTFDCPTGLYPNSVAGGSSFQARSGDGPWLPAGQVPLQGHPLYINYEVTPGAIQGQFSGPCGQNSSAASAAGLQVGQAVVLNGAADLSGCMVANDNGAVFGIQLQKVDGVYQYQINVDAQGPKGLFSGSMYLYFTDQSGDRYLLTIFDSTRKSHTLAYNSQAPAIMQIEWDNNNIH